MHNYRNACFDTASFGICLESALVEALMTLVKICFFIRLYLPLNSLSISISVYVYGPVSLKNGRMILAAS